jgi:hypothetical protein
MRKGPLLFSIKNFPKYFLCLLLFFIVFDLIVCIGSVGKTKRINVSTANLKEQTYKNVNLGKNHFTTGTDGSLYWHIKDLKEAILVNIADLNGVFNLPDLLYFLIINVFLFWFASGIKEDNIFSKVESSLRILTPLIFIYPILVIISTQIAAKCVRHLTDNQFTIQYEDYSILKYVVFGFLLQFLILFIKKGKSLQQEQDLTI